MVSCRYVCAAVLVARGVASASAAASPAAGRDLPDASFYRRDSDASGPSPASSSSSSYSYSSPEASYAAPSPSSSYSEPAVSYGAPAATYGAPPSYGAAHEEESRFPDITFIIVGILIVTGLALLFPTYVSLSTVRKRRDLDSGETDCHSNRDSDSDDPHLAAFAPTTDLLGGIGLSHSLDLSINLIYPSLST